MEIKPVSIIMPVYNSGEHIKTAIKSIVLNTQHPYELILVVSKSEDQTEKWCDIWAEQFEQIKVIKCPREGITKAINIGIKAAGDNDVYLSQDDVILPNLYGRDWLDTLVKVSQMKNCGIVTTIRGGGISGSTYLNGQRWAGTWSLFIPRKTINEIGLLDEKFSPGPGDDIDYSYRVHKAGLLIYVANFWVDHHRMTENFNDNIKEKEINATYFRKKYKLGEFK